MHYTLEHAFEHVERKGPTKNYNTKIGENVHVTLKKDFDEGNGKDAEVQV